MQKRHKDFKKNLESFCNNSSNKYPNAEDIYYGDKNSVTNISNKQSLMLKKFHSPLKNSLADLLNNS